MISMIWLINAIDETISTLYLLLICQLWSCFVIERQLFGTRLCGMWMNGVSPLLMTAIDYHRCALAYRLLATLALATSQCPSTSLSCSIVCPKCGIVQLLLRVVMTTDDTNAIHVETMAVMSTVS